MPRLLTNGSWILTHIIILHLISSKLHTVKSDIHCESRNYNVAFNSRWGWKLHATWYERIVIHHLTAGRGMMMIACSRGNWSAPKFKWLSLDSQAGDCRQAHITLTVNCTLRSCLFLTWAFKNLSLWTSLMMEICSHNQFSDTIFGSRNI